MIDGNAPAPDVVDAAFRAALRWRLQGCSGDGRYALLSSAAIRERVVIVPGLPYRRAGWWAIGALVDDVAPAEWTIWMHPERRVLRLLPRPTPSPAIPEQTRRPDGRFYDGMRRRWLLPNGSLAGDGTDPMVPT